MFQLINFFLQIYCHRTCPWVPTVKVTTFLQRNKTVLCCSKLTVFQVQCPWWKVLLWWLVLLTAFSICFLQRWFKICSRSCNWSVGSFCSTHPGNFRMKGVASSWWDLETVETGLPHNIMNREDGHRHRQCLCWPAW
jgi:hypothetical protein